MMQNDPKLEGGNLGTHNSPFVHSDLARVRGLSERRVGCEVAAGGVQHPKRF